MQEPKAGEWVGLAVVLKENNQLIGDAALKIDGQTAKIGFNISPPRQQKGYAKELLKNLLLYCFNIAEISEVIAITDAENTASIKVMESAGMQRDTGFEKVVPFKAA